MSSPLVEFDIQPRFYETDALGHINNVAITGWLELSRTRLIQHLASAGVDVPPESWVVVSILAEFLAETFYGADVNVKVTEVAFGTTSMTVSSELWQNGKLTVRGKSVLVHRDPKTGAKQPIPDTLRSVS